MIPEILSFFVDRHIPVEFRSLPTHPIDSSLFDRAEHARTLANGYFECSPAQLLQASSVHYQGRFRHSRPRQWLNACHEVLPSVEPWSYKAAGLRLNSNESTEFQAKSSEVIAVGLGLSLCRKLFQIRYQDISTIERTGKRCDFSFIKNGRGYVVETRGRKQEFQIRYAIDDVFLKKAHHSGAKYGFVCHLPREGQASSVIVVDPPFESHRVMEWERIARLLRYYSSASRLAGFWRLSELLNERVALLTDSKQSKQFNRVPLDYRNIEKLGSPVGMRLENVNASFFVPRSSGSEGLFGYMGYAFIIGLEQSLFEALESQDFDRLSSFRFPASSSEAISRPRVGACVNDDGTVFTAIPMQRLGEIVNR